MDDIIKWLTSSELDYKKGVDIFLKYSKNQVLNRSFIFGMPKNNQKRLEYEMKKLLKIPNELLFKQKCSNEQLINNFFKKKDNVLKPKTTKQNDPIKVNQEILQAKEVLKNLHIKISMLHHSLYELGESNDNKTVKMRLNILKERIPLIEKYENLYELKEDYFITGKVSNELKILSQTNISSKSTQTKEKRFNELTDIELLKTKNRIRTTITKTKNKIAYQSDVRLEKKNPLPEGPIKQHFVKKLKNFEGQYKEVCEILRKREKNVS